MNPIDSYYCDICGRYYNGDFEITETDMYHQHCKHYDKRITKEIYDEHMKILTENKSLLPIQ